MMGLIMRVFAGRCSSITIQYEYFIPIHASLLRKQEVMPTVGRHRRRKEYNGCQSDLVLLQVWKGIRHGHHLSEMSMLGATFLLVATPLDAETDLASIVAFTTLPAQTDLDAVRSKLLVGVGVVISIAAAGNAGCDHVSLFVEQGFAVG